MRKTTTQPVHHAQENHSALRVSRRTVLRGVGLGALTTTGERTLGPFSRTALAQSSPPAATPSTLAGIQVYPAHRTRTASPYTEISFRNVSPDLLGQVTVEGSKSGGHSGILSPHSDGRGASFLPDAWFEPGESVTVRAGLKLRGMANGSITFSVAEPASTVRPRVSDETAAPGKAPHAFRSRPDLQPPVIEITTSANQTAPGYAVVGAKTNSGQGGAMIVDNQGAPIWFSPPAQPQLEQVNDIRVQDYRGQPVLTWWEGGSPVGLGLGHFFIYSSSYEQIAALRVGNGYPGGDLHEFILTPQGTALVIIYHAVRWDLTPLDGTFGASVMDNIIQEIDIDTGRVLFEWHSLDRIELDESYRTPPEDIDNPLDYFHLNSIERDENGNYIISARNSFGIYKIHGDTGEVMWRLNGKRSDFAMGPNTPFAWQHDARVHPNGELTLFDNAEEDQSKDHLMSRGMVLTLDEDAMTATLEREYIHPTEILSASQGNMQVLPNGNVFIGWGSAPVFSEFSHDGGLLFNARFPINENSYRAYRFPWTGTPTTPPDMAIETGAGYEITVYASWNGATGVTRWDVLAGPELDELEPVDSAPRDGFETAITVRTPRPFVAVQALDASGQILGISEVVRARA